MSSCRRLALTTRVSRWPDGLGRETRSIHQSTLSKGDSHHICASLDLAGSSHEIPEEPTCESGANADAEGLAQPNPVTVARLHDPAEDVHVHVLVLMDRHVAEAHHPGQ